ncbi:unnamed protein product [Closterium sp. NIES-65]|nr:unnamed protein product [Closterium sp. NIES-65]
MAAKCPNKKKDTTPAAAANVAAGDGKGVALTVTCSAAKLLADNKHLWFLDPGCSQHMTGRKEWFTVIRDPSATKSVKGFDGSKQEVAGVGEVLLEGTNGLRVTLHDILFVLGMKANLVSPGQLLDKGAKLQTEEGVTRIIASGDQVAAMARYRHRLHYLDLKSGPARNGATAVAACNGTAAAAACIDIAGGAASNGTGAASACNGTAAATASNGTAKEIADVASSKLEAKDGAANLKTYAVGSKATSNLWHARLGNVHLDAVKRTATSGGVFGIDLEKGGEDMPCTSCHEAKLTRKSFPLHDEREEHVLGLNPPPPRTVIVVPVPSVQGGEKPLDRSVGSKAPTAPPPLGPPSVADLAPIGTEDGSLEVDTSMADHEEEEEEVAVVEHRPNKGVPPVRFQPSAMTALDADDEDNPYDALYYKDGASGKRVWLLVYVDDLLAASEDQQLLQDLKGLLAKAFQLREVEPAVRYLGLQIVRDRPNRTLFLHQNAYVAKVQQRYFKGAPPKKQPITPLSSASFAKQDAGQTGVSNTRARAVVTAIFGEEWYLCWIGSVSGSVNARAHFPLFSLGSLTSPPHVPHSSSYFPPSTLTLPPFLPLNLAPFTPPFLPHFPSSISPPYPSQPPSPLFYPLLLLTFLLPSSSFPPLLPLISPFSLSFLPLLPLITPPSPPHLPPFSPPFLPLLPLIAPSFHSQILPFSLSNPPYTPFPSTPYHIPASPSHFLPRSFSIPSLRTLSPPPLLPSFTPLLPLIYPSAPLISPPTPSHIPHFTHSFSPLLHHTSPPSLPHFPSCSFHYPPISPPFPSVFPFVSPPSPSFYPLFTLSSSPLQSLISPFSPSPPTPTLFDVVLQTRHLDLAVSENSAAA